MTVSRTMSRAFVVTLLVALALAGIAASRAAADPYLYWTSTGGTVGRVATDGSNLDPSFVTGASDPIGPSTDGVHLYWANTSTNSIARADLDGGNVSQNLVTGAYGPLGTTVDSGHLYWLNPGISMLGRADLDGANAQQNWFGGPANTKGIAIDGNWIYWAGGGRIGRLALTGFSATSSFVPGVANPEEVAVDAHFVYWTDPVDGTIGRAYLDGSGAENDFITGVGSPSGLALDRTHLWWPDESGNTIGRANLDGSDVRSSYISGVASPTGLAVSAPVAIAVPVATASTSDLNFATQALGTFGPPETVTVKNEGQNLLLPTTAQIVGVDASDFLVSYDACSGASIAPGASCKVQVRFGPAASGTRVASLHLLSNAHTQSPLVVGLTGNGGTLPEGPLGPEGPSGGTGPQRPVGRRGATGTPAQVRLVRCRNVSVTTGRGKGRRRVKRTRCTVTVVTRTVRFTVATAGATSAVGAQLATAHGTVVAHASGRPRDGRLVLTLATNRRLPHGRYRLTVTTRSGQARSSSPGWITIL
ncbi:MAG: low-density lipoprotein receptor repeat protein [Conexibacter sp.]|nr:low-density lipoprotein receptor repeat protein [Conexibacter sp.]